MVKLVFILSAVNSIDDHDVKNFKKSRIPYNRLRGFEKGKVGPKDGDDYVGGNYVNIFKFIYKFTRYFKTLENLDFSYFIDVGNVWGVDYDSAVDQSNTIRSSTGLGMDWLNTYWTIKFFFNSTN